MTVKMKREDQDPSKMLTWNEHGRHELTIKFWTCKETLDFIRFNEAKIRLLLINWLMNLRYKRTLGIQRTKIAGNGDLWKVVALFTIIGNRRYWWVPLMKKPWGICSSSIESKKYIKVENVDYKSRHNNKLIL